MRKLLIAPVALILAVPLAAESRLFLAAAVSYVRPADANFRSVYGDQVISPEVSAAVRLVGGLCLTGSAGKLSKNGRTPDLGLETTATQSYVSIGLAYLLRASPTLCFEAGLGMAGLSFREDALDLWVKGKHPGLKLEGGVLLVPEDERVFMGLRIGYLSATVPGSELEPIGDQDVRLGGLKVSVSIGIQLFGD